MVPHTKEKGTSVVPCTVRMGYLMVPYKIGKESSVVVLHILAMESLLVPYMMEYSMVPYKTGMGVPCKMEMECLKVPYKTVK